MILYSKKGKKITCDQHQVEILIKHGYSLKPVKIIDFTKVESKIGEKDETIKESKTVTKDETEDKVSTTTKTSDSVKSSVKGK